MKRNIWNWLVMIALVSLTAGMVGCGGGGSSDSVVVACVDSTWAPDPSTQPLDVIFEQTSNCGAKREARGTKNLWIERAGDSATTLFKTFSDITNIVSTPDVNSEGVIVFGVDNTAKNNKGIVVYLNSRGDEQWRNQIDSPLGNTLTPKAIFCDGTRIVPVFTRMPLTDWLVYGIGMDGSPRALAEVNIGYNLTSAVVSFDGNNMLIGRVQPTVALPPPIPFSSTQLTRNNMAVSDVLGIVPLIDPEFITTDVAGVNVFGQGQYMKYSHDLLTVLVAPQIWSTGVNPVIHNVKTVGNETFVAGVVNDKLVLTQLGNPAFRNTASIPIGTDKIRLGSDATGNLYVSVGNRIGRVDKATGEFYTMANPPAIPANIAWYINGTSVYFVSGNNKLESLPLSRIP